MKVTYDPEVDVLRILLSSAPVDESDESKPGVVLDYDKAGNVVGVEILDASRRTDAPQTMEYAIAMPRTPVLPGALVREEATGYGSAGRRGGKKSPRKARPR